MHLWWSRKPTGLARAVLFASIVDDPVDRPDLWPSDEERHAERRRLLDLVADLSRWDCPANRVDAANRLVAQQVGESIPTMIDPFCGGGAIPLEAARLGLPTSAIDLNPVAALVTKGLIEIPSIIGGLGPVHPDATRRLGGSTSMDGMGLDVALYGEQLLADARARIGDRYPPIGQDGRRTEAVSYLWARSATCSNPGCGRELPLLSTWWLSKRAKNPWHVRPVMVDQRVSFHVHRGPPPGDLVDLKVGRGANFRCHVCGEVTEAGEIRRQGQAGELGLRLVAIQTFADAQRRRGGGRSWASATAEQEAAALHAWPSETEFPLANVPWPAVAGNIHSFGIHTIEDLLTPRQRLLMVTMCEVLEGLRATIADDAARAGLDDDPTPLREGGQGTTAYAEAVATYLALTISRMANRVSTMTVHNRANGSVEQSFIQPAYAFYGDFPEANPFSGSTGSFANSLEHVAAATAALPVGPPARVTCSSALTALPGMQGIVSTDPPYYDMFDYAAMSNLFYPWLRLALREVWPDETASLLAPEADQIVSNVSRFDGSKAKAHAHFETRLREAFKALRATQLEEYPLTLYYGYQQTEQ